MATVRTIKTGRADVSPTAAAHTPGVRQGQREGRYRLQPGHRADGTSTARRSTGINPQIHDPIDPRMPNLSPA
jgi:hypothetical protein